MHLFLGGEFGSPSLGNAKIWLCEFSTPPERVLFDATILEKNRGLRKCQIFAKK